MNLEKKPCMSLHRLLKSILFIQLNEIICLGGYYSYVWPQLLEVALAPDNHPAFAADPSSLRWPLLLEMTSAPCAYGPPLIPTYTSSAAEPRSGYDHSSWRWPQLSEITQALGDDPSSRRWPKLLEMSPALGDDPNSWCWVPNSWCWVQLLMLTTSPDLVPGALVLSPATGAYTCVWCWFQLLVPTSAPSDDPPAPNACPSSLCWPHLLALD